MKRILVVSVNWFGDALMTTPAFTALKMHYPNSSIGVMAPARVKDVYTNNPAIDEVLSFDERSTHRGLWAKIKFIRTLKKKKFDTVFLIHRSFTRALICKLAGIKERIGYQRRKSSPLLTTKIKRPQEMLHRQDHYLYLFEKSGVDIANRLAHFFVPDAAQKKAATALAPIKKKYKRIIGINPSANWALKRWPLENFAALIRELTLKPHCAVIIVGNSTSKPIAKKLIKLLDNLPEKQRCALHDLCGKTTIKELAAYMQHMDLFISNDSGPAHLAAALGVNTLVLFGPTSPYMTSPRGLRVKIIHNEKNCSIPCYNVTCHDNLCMQKITVREVVEETQKILQE